MNKFKVEVDRGKLDSLLRIKWFMKDLKEVREGDRNANND